MEIQLNITSSPVLPAPLLEEFCKLAKEKGKSPEEALVEMIEETLEEQDQETDHEMSNL